MKYLLYLFALLAAYNEYTFYVLFPFITETFLQSNNENILIAFWALNSFNEIGKIFGFGLWKYSALKIKSKNLISFCYFLSCLIYIFYGFCSNIYMLAASRFLFGIIASNFDVVKKYMKDICKRSESNKHLILTNMFSKLGSVLGILAGSYLYINNFTNSNKFPLLSIGIVSSITMFLVSIINITQSHDLIRCSCDYYCKNQRQGITVNSDSSSDDENQQDEITTARNDNIEIDEKNKNIFICYVVLFSGFYNILRYIVIIYMFYFGYSLKSISNIWAIIEGTKFITDLTVKCCNQCIVENKKTLYIFSNVFFTVIPSAIIYAITSTKDSIILQSGFIIGLFTIVDTLYNINTLLNNNTLKKYRTYNTKWNIYSFVIIFTMIFTMCLVTCFTFLIRNLYYKDIKTYVIDKHTPFYILSILFMLLNVLFIHKADQITNTK